MWHKSQEKIPNLLIINRFGIQKVEIIGFEPMTSCMPCKRSSQLSYTPEGRKYTHALRLAIRMVLYTNSHKRLPSVMYIFDS